MLVGLWSSATTTYGEQSVVIIGTQVMQMWYAGNLDIMVCHILATCIIPMFTLVYELPLGEAIAYSYAYFGVGIGPVVLSNVSCLGNESSLHQCASTGVSNNCAYTNVAGVRCYAGKMKMYFI